MAKQIAINGRIKFTLSAVAAPGLTPNCCTSRPNSLSSRPNTMPAHMYARMVRHFAVNDDSTCFVPDPQGSCGRHYLPPGTAGPVEGEAWPPPHRRCGPVGT